jgi:acetyl esterase/lipase
MRRFVTLSSLSILVVTAMLAQSQPDFSGRWVLQGPENAGADVARTLIIQQPIVRTNVYGAPIDPTFLRVTIERQFPSSTRTDTYLIGTQGGTVSGTIPGGPTGSTTVVPHWEGQRLVIDTSSTLGSTVATRSEVLQYDAAGALTVTLTERPAGAEPKTTTATYRRDAPLPTQSAWQPSSGHTQLPIWPGPAPDARAMDGPEVAGTVVDAAGKPQLVAGKPWTYVDKVSDPTLTLYSPQGRNTGAAVVVFPGGGYNVLAIDLEGTEVCDWLTSRGIACVLLKYRVPCVKVGPYRDCPTALQDAQRTVGLVRSKASEWQIDPHKIGVLGFSAGGHMVAAISTHFEKRLYSPVDAADRESCRPDFAVALYPGHLAVPEKNFALNPDLRVTSRTPPTFLLQAEDDPVDPVENSLVYYSALKSAGVPAELHIFVKGGHAFGLRATESPITRWPQLVETWLTTIGMLQPK